MTARATLRRLDRLEAELGLLMPAGEPAFAWFDFCTNAELIELENLYRQAVEAGTELAPADRARVLEVESRALARQLAGEPPLWQGLVQLAQRVESLVTTAAQ